MTKILAILVCISIATNAHAQSATSNEIIVEGAAKTKIKPDIAMMTLAVEKSDTVESNAIRSLNEQSDQLAKSLFKLGFRNNNVQISNYDISSNINRQGQKIYTASSWLK